LPVSLAPNAIQITSPLAVTGLTGTMVDARFHIFLTTPDDSLVNGIDVDFPLGGNNPGFVSIYDKFFNGALSGANMGTGCAATASTTFRRDSTKAITSGTAPYVDEFHGWQGVTPSLDDAFTGPATGYNGTWTMKISFTGSSTTATLNCWSVDVVTSP
jgi:hypothetical protein